LNFVKTKLALEKLAKGDVLEVWIVLDGQSAINIPNSIRQEGHEVLDTEDDEANGLQKIWIRRQ
jgi:TusA-related sulfurtransferase